MKAKPQKRYSAGDDFTGEGITPSSSDIRKAYDKAMAPKRGKMSPALRGPMSKAPSKKKR